MKNSNIKNPQPIQLEIDVNKYQELVDNELERQARGTIDTRLKLLFINPSDHSQYEYLKNRSNNDPDLAAAHNFIKELIDKKLLDDKFQKHIENYVERNFTRFLDEALEKALKHKANNMAFKMAKNRLTIDGYNKFFTNGELRQFVDDNVKKI